MAKTKVKKDGRSQRQKFIDTAREVGADEDEESFQEALKTVASAPVPKSKKSKD